ncbi:glutamine synthetase family protein [Streptomyces coelicoflavus]|uniref:glutamine synthetase family protein n=1 Tax=Streptomyces coelicoflavus TaxID=285562 RepID=UPI0024AE6394|nr:glutamine synthetase family protein [Streptomyces coelicoflavus]MDI6521501.1 glutamine synthetase family protein [Streptomyces coelicoflavus]
MYVRSWSSPAAEGSVGQPSFVARHGLWDEARVAAAERVEASLADVDLVRLVFGDPHGLARSKTLTAEAFRGVLRNGMNYSPGPFVFDTGHAVAVDFLGDHGIGVDEIAGAGNFVLVPDPLTFQPLPGGDARTAWVIGDEYLRDGSPHPLSSRAVLRRVVDRYTGQGLAPVLGLEVEWYLTRRLDDDPGNTGNGFGLQGRAPRVAALNAGYQFNLDGHYDSVAHLTDPLALHLLALGLPLRSMEHESGPGQVETTFSPMSALDTADAMLLFRTVAKSWCARRGHHASFMSQPLLDAADPSGWHLNQSVTDLASGHNLFGAEGPSGGLSPHGKAYAEGLLDWARELCLLSVPTVNGYRRLAAEHTLAPTRPGWSEEDRSAMVRVVGHGAGAHLENRIGEPCANPYLAVAAQLFAGLEGLTARPDPQDAATAAAPAPGGAPGLVPQHLREALDAFRAGRAARLLGEPLAACLAKLKESELRRYEAWCLQAPPTPGRVSDWEQREYFGAY